MSPRAPPGTPSAPAGATMEITMLNETTNERLLTDKQVAYLLGISIRSVWRMADKGTLPKPIKILRLARWKITEIQSVMDNLPRAK